MPFVTKLDFSNNRQVKQYPETLTALSGTTVFGVPFSYLPVGANLETVIVTQTLYNLTSTFSGNSGTTVYTWADSRMNLATPYLSALTPTISATTQNTGQVFTAATTGTSYDGFAINTSYTGVTFDATPNLFVNLGGGNYSGTVYTNTFQVLSASALDYSGRTLWLDVSGTSRTSDLVITKSPQINYVWTCISSEGDGAWSPVSGTTGATVYWSADSGFNAIVVTNSGSKATSAYALAEGYQSTAMGVASHAEGYQTTAKGSGSHTEGYQTYTELNYSHAEGYQSTANTIASHAEGYQTLSSGGRSHSEGSNTTSSGFMSHAEGNASISLGSVSHAEGHQTISSGTYSHSEGDTTTASGQSSHSQNYNTTAAGNYSHAGGVSSIASGATSFVHGSNSQANGTSTIVLGDNITGNTSHYTYVESLNVKTVGSTAFVNQLRIDANGNLTTNTSDERLKENIQDISNPLDIIKRLRGVSYQWKDRNSGGDDVKLGFIAQEVEEVDPRLVFTNKVDGYKGLNSDGILPLLVESVKILSSGVTQSGNTLLQTETVVAEDNNIELNFGGTQQTAIGGGLKIKNGLGNDVSIDFLTDSDGNWVTNTDLKAKGLVIPTYTPSGSADTNGNIGNITRDDNYLYIKSAGGWKRTSLELF